MINQTSMTSFITFGAKEKSDDSVPVVASISTPEAPATGPMAMARGLRRCSGSAP